MPTSYKTPGVYLVEKDAFPGSVVEVGTRNVSTFLTGAAIIVMINF